MYLVELTTTAGKVSESYETYEEARRRVDSLPAEVVVGLPLIFKQLADGSERLVREDGKPLQWHRIPEREHPSAGPDLPLPLADESSGLLGEGRWVPLPAPEPQEDECIDGPL